MANKLVFHPLAERDLYAIYELIAEDSPERAIRYIRGLRQHSLILQDMPECGVLREDLGAQIRLLVFKRQVTMAYRIEERLVRVLRIFYAGADTAEAEWPDADQD